MRDLPCGDLRLYLECDLRRVDCRRCGGVKRERLDWLAANPHDTKRVARYVGKQCRGTSIKEVAEDLRLDWHAVKEMDKLYMREQLARADVLRPAVIGVDEISIRKGPVYRIVVSDLERRQPLWFGGVDRSEASMAMFYDFLGAPRSQRIRLAVMDMWKPFRNVTEVHAPRAAIRYDKVHVLRHLNDAMDQVRKAEYKRLTNRPDRTYIQGQKYVRKEPFGQLWDDRREPWARTFFDQWTASLRWQRLKPFEKFAAMIERHWDGIAAYCRPENQIALGFVEGLNNKIRMIQRRCYGLRDEDDLHLKILTCTLPPLPRTYIARKSPTRIPEAPLMFGAAVGMFAF